jgi:glycerol uptake facilitator-like aquaporin
MEIVRCVSTILYRCIAEFCGTFFLYLFATGSVANAVFSGALSGLWQVAMIWGFVLSIAIYATASALT